MLFRSVLYTVLLQQLHDIIGLLIGLRQHTGACLLQNIVVGIFDHFGGDIRIPYPGLRACGVFYDIIIVFPACFTKKCLPEKKGDGPDRLLRIYYRYFFQRFRLIFTDTSSAFPPYRSSPTEDPDQGVRNVRKQPSVCRSGGADPTS